MPTATTPCPNRRCGVENHDIGSDAHKRCQAIGTKLTSSSIHRLTQGMDFGTITSATRLADLEADPDVNAFKGVLFADSTHVDSVIHNGRETAYVYDVEMESNLTDEPVTVRYTKGLGAVQKFGDPTAAEVMSGLAMDRRSLRQVQDEARADGASDEDDLRQRSIAILGQTYGHDNRPDWNNPSYDENDNETPGPSEAEKVYDGLLESAEQIEKLVGTNNYIVLEALRESEGEDFDEEGWRYDLGMDSVEDQKFQDQASAAAAEWQQDKAEMDATNDDIDSAESYMAWEEAQASEYYADHEAKVDAYTGRSVGAYLITALESGVWGDPGQEPTHDFEIDDVDLDAQQKVEEDLRQFAEENWNIVKDLDPVQVATDFYNARNRNGVDFTDRGLGEKGALLNEAARKYGEINAYVDDAGKVYFE